MLSEELLSKLKKEIVFQTSRSSGAGGQHVNKVNTRVELRFSILETKYLTTVEKDILMHKLSSRINSEGELLLVCEATRSQLRNKEECLERFSRLIEEALKPAKERKVTRPTLASKNIRLETKKLIAQKKQNRKKPLI